MSSSVQEFVVEIAPGIPAKIIYAGDGDSIFVDWTQGKSSNLQEIKLTGTAIATNNFFKNYERPKDKLRFFIDYPEFSSDPDKFYANLVREWNNEIERVDKFKTVDAIGLSSTVKEVYKKLITSDYLTTALYNYPDKRNIDLKNPDFDRVRKKLAPLEQMLKPFEEKLVGWNEYDKYLYKSITSNLPQGTNEDSVFYAVIMKRQAGNLRNVLLYDYATKRIKESRDSVSRLAIMQQMKLIDNKDMQADLQAQVDLLNRLRKGKPAPFINLHNANNESVSLSSLRGKFVLIDAWATWCSPCMEQAPIFERLSEKYRGSPIVFVSISIDEDLSAWEMYVRKKKNRIVHWRSLDNQFFTDQYGFNTIPHYILLDPEGNFINANLPYPSESNFEILLRKELHLPEEEG
ncbi:MAG: TlpA family protein disulfide reductase [Sediminibacterium sp.]|nr:TlpA family protein disulfide reductase [Sediminibacterium sp.]